MAYPRQKRGIVNKAVAPYNFVPLPDRVYCPTEESQVDHSRFMPGRLSGAVDIVLTTETRLYIRAPVTPDYASRHPEQLPAVWQDGSQYREFFHHGMGAPVIPGSSVRGMVRQLVEVLSDGALTTAPRAGLVYRAIGDSSRFGSFYRRRFVGPNTRSVNGAIAPDPLGLPQTIEYPVRVPNTTNPWKKNAVHGGYLIADGRDWKIVPAQRHPAGSEESFVHVPTSLLPLTLRANFMANLGTHPVWVKPASRAPHPHRGGQLDLVHAVTADPVEHRAPAGPGSTPPNAGYVPGWLVLTGSLLRNGQPTKHMHCVFFEPAASGSFEVPPRMQRTYLDDEKARWRQEAGRRGRLLPRSGPEDPVVLPARLPSTVSDSVFPVFYIVDASDKLVYFGPTLFFRLPYRQTPVEFVEAPEALDLAQAIFGTVDRQDDPAVRRRIVKGRVRFDDLTMVTGQADPSTSYCTPDQLLEPKPTCIQHYLVQPSADALRHYDDPPWHKDPTSATSTVLRGWKFYWHKGSRNGQPFARGACRDWTEFQNNAEARKTRTVIRPVRDNLAFRGRIHFDNLTSVELGSLLMALELRPDLPEQDRTMRHKLGMARKLGFGTVRLTVDSIHVIVPQERYAAFFQNGSLHEGWRSDSTEVANAAIKAFVGALQAHRGTAVRGDATWQQAVAAFWEAPRIRELSALLEWNAPPPLTQTEDRPVQHDQWRRKLHQVHLLPLPSEVIGWSDPWAGVPDPTHAGAPPVPAPPAPTGRAGSNPPVVATLTPTQHVWNGVTLALDPGPGRLTIRNGNQTAFAGGELAKTLQQGLDEARRSRLKSKKQLRVNARIDQIGGELRIVGIEPV